MTAADSTITPISPSPAATAATQRAGSAGGVRRPVSGTGGTDFRAALGAASETPQWLPSSEPEASNAAAQPERRLPPQLELTSDESDQLYENRIAIAAVVKTASASVPASQGQGVAPVYRSASRSYAAAYFSTGSGIAGRGERVEVSA